MGKPKRKNKGGYKPPPVDPETVLCDLEKHAADIAQASGAEAGPLWGAVHKLLLKTELDSSTALRLIGTRDVDALNEAIRHLRGDGSATIAEPERLDVPDIDPETARKAMKAFRKRLKLVRLDHESKLGVGPMSGGKKADIDAIMAPREFPDEVWDALVNAGELKRMGSGFYQLAEEA